MIAIVWVITDLAAVGLMFFAIVAIIRSYCRWSAIDLKSRCHVWNTHRIAVIEFDKECYGIEVIKAEDS